MSENQLDATEFDMTTKDLEKHKEWTEYINQRLEVIYREICEYEKIINLQNDESLLGLLEQINVLHKTAEDLSISSELKAKTVNIDKQIDVLENTMQLLKLENPTLSQNGFQEQDNTEMSD